MSRPTNEASVEITNNKGRDSSDLTVIKPAKVKMISEGINGRTFSSKIKMVIAK